MKLDNDRIILDRRENIDLTQSIEETKEHQYKALAVLIHNKVMEMRHEKNRAAMSCHINNIEGMVYAGIELNIIDMEDACYIIADNNESIDKFNSKIDRLFKRLKS